ASSLLPEKSLQDLAQRSKVQSFESPTVHDVVDANGSPLKLRARTIFQTVTKVELDFAASAASGQDFTELSEKIKAVMAPSIDNLYSGLMDELLPLDKPKRQDSILDMLKADVLGVILSEDGKPEKTEELLKAIAVKTSPDKAAAVEEAYRKHLYSGLMDELLPLDKPKRQDSVSVRKHFESFESFVVQSGDLIREGHHRCGRRRTADVTIAANCDIRVT